MIRRKIWTIFMVAGLVLASLGGAGVAQAGVTAHVTAGSGTAVFWDSAALSDAITVTMSGVDFTNTDQALEGWLITDDGATKLSLGVFTIASDGSINHTYISPTGANLIALHNKFVITVEPVPDTDPGPSAEAVFVETIPAGAMAHIRHVLSSWAPSVDGKGLGVGAREQTQLALTHAKLAQSAAGVSNFVGAKLHAEHVVNILEGPGGPNYGDLDGNGTAENPGDGWAARSSDGVGGAFRYLDEAAKHGIFAQGTDPGDAVVGQFADSAKASYDSAAAFATLGRDNALSIIRTSATLAGVFATSMVADLTKAVEGIDADGDGVVEPIAGEAGVNVAYVESQMMATFTLPEVGVETGDIFNIQTLSLIGLAAGMALILGGGLLRLRLRRATR